MHVDTRRRINLMLRMSATMGLGMLALATDSGQLYADDTRTPANAPLEATHEVGRLMAQSCLGCHHQAVPTTIPSIHGRPPVALARTLNEFKRGARPSTVMTRIARGYSDDELQLIAKELTALQSD